VKIIEELDTSPWYYVERGERKGLNERLDQREGRLQVSADFYRSKLHRNSEDSGREPRPGLGKTRSEGEEKWGGKNKGKKKGKMSERKRRRKNCLRTYY